MGEEYIRTQRVHGQLVMGGNVCLVDNMEDILKWGKWTSGPGDYVLEKSQDYVLSGNYSLHLKTRVTGAAGSDWISARRQVNILVGRGLICECCFLMPNTSTLRYIRWNIYWSDQGYQHNAYIRWNRSGQKWQYRDPDAVWQDMPGGAINLWEKTWTWLRWGLHLTTHRYGVFSLGGIRLDLSDFPYFYGATSAAAFLEVKMEVETSGAAATEAYIDSFALYAA